MSVDQYHVAHPGPQAHVALPPLFFPGLAGQSRGSSCPPLGSVSLVPVPGLGRSVQPVVRSLLRQLMERWLGSGLGEGEQIGRLWCQGPAGAGTGHRRPRWADGGAGQEPYLTPECFVLLGDQPRASANLRLLP